MLAVKAARHRTGRPLLLKSIGAYHGSRAHLRCIDFRSRTKTAPEYIRL